MVKRFSVRSIGAHAARIAPGALTGQACVVAVFETTFYVRTQGGLLCVTTAAVDDGPNSCRTNAKGDWRKVGLQVGQTVQLKSFLLRVDGVLDLKFEAARIWEPQPIALSSPSKMTAETLHNFRQRVSRQNDVSGLGQFLLPEFRPDTGDALCQRAAPLIGFARQWVVDAVQGAPGLPGEWAVSLMGAGPGLTPSGDDFLGGVLIGLHAFGHPATANALWRQIEPHLHTRTNEISAALLTAASKGQGSAAVHEVIAALAANHDRTGLDLALAGIARIGHSSGWDTLLGIVMVFEALAATRESCAA